MSARPMHQPPNPSDMRRLPPASPSCARVRAKLRDYADGDLPMVDVASVDEHMQGCRACAVELARAEHEVLRLRRAFEEIRVEQEADPSLTLRSDFAARVVEQLVLTDAADGAGSESGGSETDAPATADAVDSNEVRQSVGVGVGVGVGDGDGDGDGDELASGQKQAARERDFSIASPAGMLLAGAFALFILSVGTRLFDWSVGEPEPVGRLVILSSGECYDVDGQLLGGGDIVGEKEGMWVRNGSTTMDWRDGTKRAQPAATLELQDGEVQFKDGAPMLVGGRVFVETHRDVMIPMADGSRVALGKGEYLIAAIPADMIEDGNFDPNAVPFGATPADVRIEIEVVSGQDAKIFRTDGAIGVVGAGSVANYQGGGLIDIYSSNPIAGRFQGDRKPAPGASDGPVSLLVGHVMGPNGQPSVGAGVRVTYISDEKAYSEIRTSGPNGSFSVPTEGTPDATFGVAFLVPNVQRSDLGLVAPDAVPLVIHEEVAQFERPLSIGYSTAISGLVRNDLGQPQFAVQVVPLIIDELFGGVFALDFMASMTAENGRFLVKQLPSYLPRHQRLALLLTHESLETTVVPVPIRGDALASLENQFYTMKRLQTVGLHSLPRNSAVTILEEISGLPAGVAVVRRVVHSNAVGYAPMVKVGSGRIWLHSGSSTPRLKRMAVQSLGVHLTFLHPTGDWINYHQRLRPMQHLPHTQVQLENSIRHHDIQVEEIENIVQSLPLHVVDAAHKNVQRAQVFAVSRTAILGDPATRFLGFTGDNGVLSLGAVKADEDVFVIGPSGALAWVAQPTVTNNSAQPVMLQLRNSGRVLLGQDLRPAAGDPERFVKVTFRLDADQVLEGMQPVAVRFATDEHWEMGDLPAGRYTAEVNGMEYSIEVPSTGFATLTGQ